MAGRESMPSAAIFMPPAVSPNSLAALTELMASSPPLFMATTSAFEACACSTKEEKSVEPSGAFTEPTTSAPAAFTAPETAASSAAPKA